MGNIACAIDKLKKELGLHKEEPPSLSYKEQLISIMIIDDDEDVLKSLKYLFKKDYQVIACESGREGIMLLDDSIQSVILDIRMEKMNGFEVFMKIKKKNPDIPVIFHTAFQGVYDPVAVWNKFRPFGYVTKGSGLSVLKDTLNAAVNYRQKLIENKRLISELQRLNQDLEKKVEEKTRELKHLVMLDGLTGIYNRRYFKEALSRMIAESKRYATVFCLLFVDLDDFKQVNNTYGHQAGDLALKKITALFSSLIRQTDVLARYGGEEFVFLLGNTNFKAGTCFAERLRSAMEAYRINLTKGTVTITLSLGISCSSEIDSLTADKIIGLADNRMYCAKSDGKNKVVTN